MQRIHVTLQRAQIGKRRINLDIEVFLEKRHERKAADLVIHFRDAVGRLGAKVALSYG